MIRSAIDHPAVQHAARRGDACRPGRRRAVSGLGRLSVHDRRRQSAADGKRQGRGVRRDRRPGGGAAGAHHRPARPERHSRAPVGRPAMTHPARTTKCPTHLNVEDKVVFGLTARQFLYVLVGSSASYSLWEQAPALGDAAARGDGRRSASARPSPSPCWRPADRPLEEWLAAACVYAGSPGRATWQPREPIAGGLATERRQLAGAGAESELGGGRRRMKHASVQTARLGIEAIQDGVVALAGGEYRAVLEVGGTASPFEDDVRQEALLAGFAVVSECAQLSDPDPGPRQPGRPDALRGRRRRARSTAARRAARRAGQRPRRVRPGAGPPADCCSSGASTWSCRPRASAPPGWSSRLRRAAARRSDAEPRREAARHQLTFRCDDLARQLGALRPGRRRLADLELAQLYLACWSPERARAQRFRQQLDDYTTLAVRAARRSAGAADGVAACCA